MENLSAHKPARVRELIEERGCELIKGSGPSTRRRSFAFIMPIGNLILTEAVGREFRVDRVAFVNRDKLPRIRKRLGLGAPVSEVKKVIPGYESFESAGTFAVDRQGGTKEEVNA